MGREKEQGWEVSLSALVYFFVQPVKDQHLVNQTWFYSAKWGISPRTTSKVGQDEVTAVCWGRQHKPWLPNTPCTHTFSHRLLALESSPGVHRETTVGSVPQAMPWWQPGQTALQGSAAILSQWALSDLPVTGENNRGKLWKSSLLFSPTSTKQWLPLPQKIGKKVEYCEIVLARHKASPLPRRRQGWMPYSSFLHR